VECFLVALERVHCVANLVAEVASVSPVCGEVAALEMLFAGVTAPRHFGAERADHETVWVTHQVAVSQLLQPRVQTYGTQKQQLAEYCNLPDHNMTRICSGSSCTHMKHGETLITLKCGTGFCPNILPV
jgi:hypothetical protein